MDDGDCWEYQMQAERSDDWMADDVGLGPYAVLLLR